MIADRVAAVGFRKTARPRSTKFDLLQDADRIVDLDRDIGRCFPASYDRAAVARPADCRSFYKSEPVSSAHRARAIRRTIKPDRSGFPCSTARVCRTSLRIFLQQTGAAHRHTWHTDFADRSRNLWRHCWKHKFQTAVIGLACAFGRMPSQEPSILKAADWRLGNLACGLLCIPPEPSAHLRAPATVLLFAWQPY